MTGEVSRGVSSRTRMAAVLLSLVIAGCGQARMVQSSGNGGLIALDGDREPAMQAAHRMMSDHCRGEYSIVEESESVVSSGAVEYRVRYQCGAHSAHSTQTTQPRSSIPTTVAPTTVDDGYSPEDRSNETSEPLEAETDPEP